MNQQQFLQECGKSYPGAMVALGYFRQLVQQRFEPVVQKRLQEMCAVLGVSRKELKLKEYADPDTPASAVPDQVELGWKAKRSENLYLYFYLYWLSEPEEDSAPQGVSIAVWIKDRDKREALAAKLDQLADDPAFEGEPWWYYSNPNVIECCMDLREDEFPQAGEKLDQLFNYTIGFLKSLKEIATYFRA